MALKLGQKPRHSSPKPHRQQSPGCHTPTPSAKPDHLLGMSSLERRDANHPLPLLWKGAGPPVTLCAGVPSRVSGEGSQGGLCWKLLCACGLSQQGQIELLERGHFTETLASPLREATAVFSFSFLG